MVLPLLYGLGAKDYLEPKGYLILRCQKCQFTGPFALFDSKRKVTVYSIPTVSFRDQLVLECRSCTQRFAVPPDRRQAFLDRVMNEEEMIAQLRAFGIAQAAGPTRRTLYQVLQVDPEADPEVIEAAFRRLALKYHPDTSTDPEASERMREILEARACLSNPDQRTAYDRSIGIVRRKVGLRPEDI